MQKKGQVTTFIIIGITLVILISLFFGIKNFVLKSDFERQEEKHANAPIEVQPISKEIDACTERITQEAVMRIGMQGGYSEPPTEPLPTTAYTPLGATIQLTKASDINIAVWQREQPNGIFINTAPTKETITNELQKEIEESFNTCLDIDKYIEQGYSITTIGEPKAEVKITNSEVDAIVNFPLQITKQDITYPLNTHLARIDTKLGEMIDLANEINSYQETEHAIEQKAINMMVAYDDIVPFSGTNFECGKKTWKKEDVINQLKDNIYYNTQALRVKGTQNEETNAILQLNPFSDNHKDITINLAYNPDWPTLIDLQEETETIEEENLGQETATLTGSILTQFFCMNNHHVVYDIKYPVLITLTDENGYLFQFATQVIIDNNEPFKDTSERIDLPEEENKICQHATEPIEVNTYTITDDETPRILPNTEVILRCGQATCPLGETDENGHLEATAPQCANTILQAKKEGYYLGSTLVPGTGTDTVETITLEPYYEKEIIIKVIDKENGIRDQYDSETTTIYLQHEETTYATVASGEEPIKLLQGTYKITTITIGESTWPITVPKTVSQTCTDTKGKGIASFFAQPEQCFTIETESYELEDVLKGGVIYEFTFTRDMLTSERPITMYTFAEPLTTDTEKIAQRQFAMTTNAEDPSFREPHL